MAKVVEVDPTALEAVTVNEVGRIVWVGVPLTIPRVVSRVSPAGSAGVME